MKEEHTSRVVCLCRDYESIESIVAALENRKSTTALTDWLSGEPLVQRDALQKDLSCGSSCRGRVSTSFVILNAIRDAFRPFLGSSDPKRDLPKKQPEVAVVYEDAFPALSGTDGSSKKENVTTLVGRKKKKSNDTYQPATSKPKRRIRPVAVTAASTGSVWGAPKGNLVDLPSQDPLTLRDKLPTEGQRSKLNGSTPAPVKTPPRKVRPTAKESITTPPRKLVEKEGQECEDVSKIAPLAHLVDVYCTLIDKCLVPSSLLELHLLFRVLSMENRQATETPDTAAPALLNTVLSSPSRRIYFAKEALRRQARIIRGLGPPLWKELLQYPPFRKLLPSLADELETVLQKARSDSTFSMIPGVNQTALLTLPFNQERDSRHNYRTSEEQSVYQNREISRDAFLYQLRAFLSVRGKVVDASRVTKAIGVVKQSSRTVVQGLLDANLFWFSEFFCDLLLQIGLVPLEETDKELLSIADMDKLQKLHKRFSSKTSSSHESSRKIVADPNRNSSSPKEEAQLLFPGHQEFFYLFILSADSYAFGMHLRSHLIAKMIHISSGANLETLEKCLMELRMLARFLGVLLFSPNWRSTASTRTHEVASHALDGLRQLTSSGLSVIDAVESAQDDRNLVLVIPWVVELLRMTAWDFVTQRSPLYSDLLALLRQIQTQQYQSDLSIDAVERQLVSQCIEFLFGDVVGLAELTIKFPPGAVARKLVTNREDGLHKTVRAFSSNTLFACVPHVEELVSLVSSLSRPEVSSVKSPGVSRKLRPSVLSDEPVRSLQFVDTPSLVSNNDTRSRDAFKSKLRDGFFHQHAELKELCEFAVAKVLRDCSTKAFEQQSLETFHATLMDDGSDGCSELETKERVVQHCRKRFGESLETGIHKVLTTLAPPLVDQKVIKVAASLAVEYGIDRGDDIVERLAAKDISLWLQPAGQQDKVQLFAGESGMQLDSEVPPLERQVNLCARSISSLADALDCFDAIQLSKVLSPLQNVLKSLDDLSILSDANIPQESALRALFESILTLDQRSPTLVDQLLFGADSQVELRWSVLESYVAAAVEIQQWSHHGLRVLINRLQDSLGLESMIRLGLRASDPKGIAELLRRAVEVRVLRSSNLSDALTRVAESGVDGTSTVSSLVFQR
jgi:hypothetical protein